MDLKAKIEELIAKIKGDKNLAEKFQKDPSATVKGLVGVDLPKDQLDSIIEGIKAKLNLDKLGDKLGGILGKK